MLGHTGDETILTALELRSDERIAGDSSTVDVVERAFGRDSATELECHILWVVGRLKRAHASQEQSRCDERSPKHKTYICLALCLDFHFHGVPFGRGELIRFHRPLACTVIIHPSSI